MALLGTDFRATAKRTMPREWFGDTPHTHVALDDAIEQGALFCAMLAAAADLRRPAATDRNGADAPPTP